MRKKYWCEELFLIFFVKLDALCSTLRHQTQQLPNVVFVEPYETGHIEPTYTDLPYLPSSP